MAEAAEVLGISAEAVRGRIRQGTLPLEREGETVYVLLDAPLDDPTDLLIAELQDRVCSLEKANRENRRIVAALTSRIPAIEAPQETRESPKKGEDAAEMGQSRYDASGLQRSVERP